MPEIITEADLFTVLVARAELADLGFANITHSTPAHLSLIFAEC